VPTKKVEGQPSRLPKNHGVPTKKSGCPKTMACPKIAVAKKNGATHCGAPFLQTKPTKKTYFSVTFMCICRLVAADLK
jgi:hypothetical protein